MMMGDSEPMGTSRHAQSTGGRINFDRPAAETLLIRLSGRWTLHEGLPSVDAIRNQMNSDGALRRVVFDTQELSEWDSGLLTLLLEVLDQCETREIDVDREGLPLGVRRLLDLATAVPEQKDLERDASPEALLPQIGKSAIRVWRSAAEMVGFVGEATLATARLVRGKARFRSCDLLLTLQECGIQALPIVSLISFLVGLILAFIGAIQLMAFGAQIYVADLVGIAMAREMGAIMVAVVMAGRTGAAFAAQLGTMTVNEEIDALRTLGFSPMEFLVLPRMLALALMMPLLCLYANLIGIVGGTVVGVGMLDLSLAQYIHETQAAVDLTDFAVGLAKAIVFGVLVALAGCLRGLQCERNSAAVGAAATSAVVTAIVWIIVTDAVFAVVTHLIGI
jgi:phospholipid/cholesterol/gamma-HCH transport system permease protein